MNLVENGRLRINVGNALEAAQNNLTPRPRLTPRTRNVNRLIKDIDTAEEKLKKLEAKKDSAGVNLQKEYLNNLRTNLWVWTCMARSLEEMKALKPVEKQDLKDLHKTWQEYSAADDFFVRTLQNLMEKLLSSTRFNAEGAGINATFLEDIIKQLEDPYDLDTLKEPQRLICGHRTSKSSWEENGHRCPYNCGKTDQPLDEVQLGELVKQVLILGLV